MALGDKSPDFYRSPRLVAHLLATQPLVYTARDPRAVRRSIWADKTPEHEKRRRWGAFRKNYEVWREHLDAPGMLVSRFEDLVRDPAAAMARVHRHLGVGESTAFLAPGPRRHARRFIWKTNVDMASGEVRPIDPDAANRWHGQIDGPTLALLKGDPLVRDYCERFGYELGERSTPAARGRASIAAPVLAIRPVLQSRALVLDWGKGPVLDHIAASLAALGWEVARMPRSAETVPAILRELEEHPPGLCVTRQRLYRNLAPVSEALARAGTRLLVADLGVWPHYGTYVLDSAGENAVSSVARGGLRRLLASPDLRAEGERRRGQLKDMRQTLRRRAEEGERQRDRLGLGGLGSFSLVVLQRTGDQVLVYDAAQRWREPAAVARAAVAEAERAGGYVVVKAHPLDVSDLGIASTGPCHRVAPSFRCGRDNDRLLAWLLTRAENVVTVNSTVHFQALALGIPTACLGRGWFTGNGVVAEIAEMADALRERRTFEAEAYLLHLLSRQMAVEDYACPEALESLMRHVEACRLLAEARPGQGADAPPLDLTRPTARAAARTT